MRSAYLPESQLMKYFPQCGKTISRLFRIGRLPGHGHQTDKLQMSQRFKLFGHVNGGRDWNTIFRFFTGCVNFHENLHSRFAPAVDVIEVFREAQGINTMYHFAGFHGGGRLVTLQVANHVPFDLRSYFRTISHCFREPIAYFLITGLKILYAAFTKMPLPRSDKSQDLFRAGVLAYSDKHHVLWIAARTDCRGTDSFLNLLEFNGYIHIHSLR